jgi:hypothetical protein
VYLDFIMTNQKHGTVEMSPMQRLGMNAIFSCKPDSLDTATTYRDGQVGSEQAPVWFLTQVDDQFWYANQSGDCFYTYEPLPRIEVTA